MNIFNGLCFFFILLIYKPGTVICLNAPKECNYEGSGFRKGDRLEFSYEVMTSTGLSRDLHGTAGTKLKCNLILSVLRKCELTMELMNCHLDDRGPSHFYSTTENSETLAEELSRYQVYFQYNEGMVIEHQILVSEWEPLHIINMKRGIISLLQLPVSSGDKENTSVQMYDIFGTCMTEITLPEFSHNYIQTYRDLVTCNLSHVTESQVDFFSYIKTVKGGYRLAPITELSYPFESEVTCDYELGKHNSLKMARCLQRQAHIPLTFEDQYEQSVVTNISQVIKFLSKSRFGNRQVDHSLTGKRLVKLAMEFEEKSLKQINYDLEREIDNVLLDYFGQGQNGKTNIDQSAQSFRKMIQALRLSTEEKIRLVKDASFACGLSALCYRSLTDKLEYNVIQSIQEKIIISGLMSCGTTSCMNILAEIIQLNQIEKSEANSILFNAGLFYHPSSKFIQTIFEYCRNEDISRCFLSMSAMISRLNDSQESSAHKEVVGSIVFEVLTYLHETINENWKPITENHETVKEKLIKEERLLAAVLSIKNIGVYVNKYYDSLLEDEKKVTTALLSIVKNQNMSVSVARAAVQALSNIGFNEMITTELFHILNEEWRPVVLRASLFDELLLNGNDMVMMKLVKLLQNTSVENLRTFIVTKIRSLNEGPEQNYDHWRQKLNKLVEGLQFDQEENIWSKSQFTKFSHTILIPLTSLQIGGHLALNILYTPTSSLFHSLTLKGDLKIGDEMWKVFEVVIDIEGMDDVVHLFSSKLKNNTDMSSLIKDVMNLLQHKFQWKEKKNTFHFTHFSNTIAQAIQHIASAANFQMTSLPKVYIFFRLNGYDVGWITLKSFLGTLSKLRNSDNLFQNVMKMLIHRTDTFFLHAVKIFDFHKIIPTISGYPLDTYMDAAIVAKFHHDIKEHLKTNKLALDAIFQPSISAYLQASMQVSIEGYSKSRTALKLSGLAILDMSINVQHHSVNTQKEKEHFFSVTWKLGNEQFKFFGLKSDLYLLHNDLEQKILPPEPKMNVLKCLPEIYNLVSGKRLCLHGIYHNLSKSGFYNLISSFRLEGTAASDDENLNYYTFKGSWKKNVLGTPEQKLKIQLSGLGTELSRVINISLNMDEHVGLKLECSIPDANIVYLLQFKNFINSTHHHHIYASVLQQESKTLNALVYESKGYSIPMVATLFGDMSIPYNYTDNIVHFTIALSSLSLDLRYKKRIHTATYATNDIIVKYYCEPKLRLLYAFHPVPRLAAKQDHTSIFSYHQETSDTKIPLDKTWKAFYKFVLLWPDQKIYTTTEMIANLKSADRVTHLTWEYGSEIDEIHMTSHVNNMSTPDYALMDYSLSLNNIGKFAIDLKGNVLIKGKMPRLNATMKTDIIFMKKGQCMNTIEQKSERSDSCQMSSELNKKPLSLYDEMQVRILQWLQGCDRHSSSQNNCQKWLEKERFSLWWRGCNLPENEESCQAVNNSTSDILQKNYFLNLANWTYGFIGNLKLNPHRMHSVAVPEGGLMLQLVTNSTWPKADEPFLATNGSLYLGRKRWVKLDMIDYLHKIKFNLQGEHLETPMVFQHDHSWTITKTSQHNLDRSFKIHIDFEHYKLFDYGLILCSPRTNITHRINYSKISEHNHTIRASAVIHSVQPDFRLNYLEATDVIGQNIVTHIKMMNTLFNYELNVNKKSDVFGMIMTGNLSADGRLLGTEGKTIFSTSLILQKNCLPQWNLTYLFDNFSGISVGVMLRNPKAIRLTVNFLNIDKSKKNYEHLISLTSELNGPKVLLHKFELSSLIAKIIHQKLHMLQRNISENIQGAGKVLAQNMKAQLKDIVWPLLNETLSEYFKRKNISEEVVNITNDIWLDLPLVQAIKLFHIDESLANAIQLTSQLFSHWILHPPFFINNFIKVHIYPNVLVALTEKPLNISQHLIVNMPTFLQLPKMPVDEKKLLAFIKHKTKSTHIKEKDVAVIIDGKRIKTFDGVIYDITEPPADLCTYLMSCDLKNGYFSLTYTKSGLTLSLQKYSLTIAKDGSVFSFGKVKIDSLPFYSRDGHFFFNVIDGEFHLDVAFGSVHLIFNPLQQFYILAIDKHLKNATLGLLGTNNFEKGDDFRLPSGILEKNSIDFQNGYELSNSSQCHISVPPGFISCMTSSDQACSLFSHPDLEVCNTLINPQFFKLQCQVDFCQNQSVCRSVSAYAAACFSQGIHINLPSHCINHCGDRSGLDIVIVQSLHAKLLKAHDPLHALRHLLASFESDISFGLVTYGGNGSWKNPKTHLLNGKLFEKSSKVLLKIPLNISTTESETLVEDAVIAAANYPFQMKHSKIILLIYPHAAVKNSTKPNLVKYLYSRGITLVAASVYHLFEEKQIIGLLTDGKTIGNSQSVTKPEDAFTSTVQDTKGMWINLDVLTAGQQANIRKIVYELTTLNSKKKKL